MGTVLSDKLNMMGKKSFVVFKFGIFTDTMSDTLGTINDIYKWKQYKVPVIKAEKHTYGGQSASNILDVKIHSLVRILYQIVVINSGNF